jgi:hypothetical protein
MRRPDPVVADNMQIRRADSNEVLVNRETDLVLSEEVEIPIDQVAASSNSNSLIESD